MKSTMKQLSLVIIGMIIFTLSFTSELQAQTSGKHAIKDIKKQLSIAEIVIPNSVMREFEDLQYKAAKLTNLERAQYDLKMHVPQSLHEKVYSEDFLAELSERSDDYHASDYFKAYKKQRGELFDQSLKLLEPYLEEPNRVPPPSAQATRQEVDEYYANAYRQIYRMPENDIAQIQAIDKEISLVNDKFIKIIHKRNSPEFKTLVVRMDELSRERRKITLPYERQHLRRQQAIQSIRNRLKPR